METGKFKQLNAVRGILKPLFQSKLKLKRIITVSLDADVEKDTYILAGSGDCSMTGVFQPVRMCDKAKLSDHKAERSMLIRKARKSIKDYKEVYRVKLTFNYDTGICTGECWYQSTLLNKDGKNRDVHREFESKF